MERKTLHKIFLAYTTEYNEDNLASHEEDTEITTSL